jgi:hypothetical protein
MRVLLTVADGMFGRALTPPSGACRDARYARS